MNKSALAISNQFVTSLTVADLENIIADVVRRVLRDEMRFVPVSGENGKRLPEAFLATFGAWEDSRPAETIVSEIYESRTVSTLDVDL